MKDFERYLKFQKEVTESKLKIINSYLKGADTKQARRTSKTKTVENILRVAGHPLHISEIIEIARKDFKTNLERDSVVSILIKKIKAGKKFKRTAPNTFALME